MNKGWSEDKRSRIEQAAKTSGNPPAVKIGIVVIVILIGVPVLLLWAALVMSLVRWVF